MKWAFSRTPRAKGQLLQIIVVRTKTNFYMNIKNTLFDKNKSKYNTSHFFCFHYTKKIYHEFLGTPRRGSHVKSDKTHTHMSSRYTP